MKSNSVQFFLGGGHGTFARTIIVILTYTPRFRVCRGITIETNFAELALILGTISGIIDTFEAIASFRVTVLNGIRVNVPITFTFLTRSLRASDSSRISKETINTRVTQVTLGINNQ
jgi:hypothetical protein